MKTAGYYWFVHAALVLAHLNQFYQKRFGARILWAEEAASATKRRPSNNTDTKLTNHWNSIPPA